MDKNSSAFLELIKVDMRRIVELNPTIHSLIAKLDLGTSNVYSTAEAVIIANTLRNVLAQMDADLVALIDLLEG